LSFDDSAGVLLDNSFVGDQLCDAVLGELGLDEVNDATVLVWGTGRAYRTFIFAANT
jgi:hypothetical protein